MQLQGGRTTFASRTQQGHRSSYAACTGANRSQSISSSAWLVPSAPSGALLNTAGACSASPNAARKSRQSAVAVQASSPSGDKMTIAITGATGLVGSRLTSKLASQGHKVRVLTRDVNSAKSKLPYPGLTFYGPSQWDQGIAGATGVVNLAGEPIATRWTPEHKASIKSSRVNATKKVVSAIAAAPAGQRPGVLVSASAVGFYGNSQTDSFAEDSRAGSDYLAEICREWEGAALEVESKAPGVRPVIMRIGIVLASDGGALGKMLPMFQIFAGGPLGSGRQWMSWIHRDDLVDLIISALSNPGFKGIYNATAPKPVRMSELCSELGGLMGRPSWLPVPDFALQTLLGEGATVVLEGQKVLPVRTQAAGFNFKYPELKNALRNILRR